MSGSGGDARGLTLRDIARAAGVSVAAVSQALNNTGSLNPETRERIRGIAAELGYAPNQYAAALRRRRSMAIGFVAHSSGAQPSRQWASSYATQLTALVRAAAEHGYSVTVLPEDRPELLVSSRVDAIYLPDARVGESVVAAAMSSGLPVVTNDARLSYEAGIRVNVGYAEATRNALDRLAAGGSARPCLLTGESSTNSVEGEHAYLMWCEERGIEPLIGNGCTDQEKLENTAIELVRTGADALFSLAEQGPNILIGLSRDGVVLPRDLQLIAMCIDECDVNQRLDIAHVCVHPECAPALAMTALVAVLDGSESDIRDVDVPWDFHSGATLRPTRTPAR